MVGSVVWHVIDDYFQRALMSRIQETIKSRQVPKARINGSVVRDVVPAVYEGRYEKGRDPQCINSQNLVEIRKSIDYSGEIAEAVAGGVPETGDIDVIDNSFMPPTEHGLLIGTLSRGEHRLRSHGRKLTVELLP